ncbi:MAG: hypothetical protein AAB552_00620 [Patescibacteria group bacterium]
MFVANSLDGGICKISDWSEQLATLTRTAWTGKDGKCYFPYLPLTTKEHWEQSVLKQWESNEMVSWVLVSGHGRILAHVAVVKRHGYHELGRFVAYPDSPKNAVTSLCYEAMSYVSVIGDPVLVETTQAHTASQFICEKIGLRFAGIGFLSVVDDISWDIIYYDNLDVEDFVPQEGILGDPLRKPVVRLPEHKDRLEIVRGILSCEQGGDIPPSKFHVLPHRLEVVRLIVS